MMNSNLFAIAVDRSNDNGIEKINPITVWLFDIEATRVTTQLLDMCLTTGIYKCTMHNCYKSSNVIYHY